MWFLRKRSLGQRGEDLAARHLRRAGYKILERNVHLGKYEIDIIAREGDTVAFVEVKTRVDDSIAHPEDNVHRTKQQKIRRAAQQYIEKNGAPDTYYRFDIVAVLMPPGRKPEITLLRDAF